jgi:hypothetical protein
MLIDPKHQQVCQLDANWPEVETKQFNELTTASNEKAPHEKVVAGSCRIPARSRLGLWAAATPASRLGQSGGCKCVAHTEAAALEQGEERTTSRGRRIGEAQAQIVQRHLGSWTGRAPALEASITLLQRRCESAAWRRSVMQQAANASSALKPIAYTWRLSSDARCRGDHGSVAGWARAIERAGGRSTTTTDGGA